MQGTKNFCTGFSKTSLEKLNFLLKTIVLTMETVPKTVSASNDFIKLHFKDMDFYELSKEFWD